MINVDLRRYGNDKEYQKMINGLISGADIDEIPDEIFMETTKIQSEVIHQKAQKIDEETTSFINDYLEKNPDVKELWEKEQKEKLHKLKNQLSTAGDRRD